MKRHFDKELNKFKAEIVEMANITEKAIHDSIIALKTGNKILALDTIKNDSKIDELEIKLEKKALHMLALHQPVAIDLRFVTTGMKIINELERIADLAVNISQRVLEINNQQSLKPLIDIPQLSNLAKEMVNEAINSFINKDEQAAIKVILKDPDANNLRDRIHNTLITDYIIKDPTTVNQAISLLITARHLERICDHAKYIAEDVIFLLDAKQIKHHYEDIKKL